MNRVSIGAGWTFAGMQLIATLWVVSGVIYAAFLSSHSWLTSLGLYLYWTVLTIVLTAVLAVMAGWICLICKSDRQQHQINSER